MSKLFFEVFPTLNLNGDTKKLLEETEVTKIGMNQEKDRMRVYLFGPRLIYKKDISPDCIHRRSCLRHIETVF